MSSPGSSSTPTAASCSLMDWLLRTEFLSACTNPDPNCREKEGGDDLIISGPESNIPFMMKNLELGVSIISSDDNYSAEVSDEPIPSKIFYEHYMRRKQAAARLIRVSDRKQQH